MAWLSLEELKKYDAKKELKKMGQAEKSAASLRSGGQPVEVVRDTGAKDAVKNLLEKHKKSRAIRKEMQSIGQDLRKNKSTDLAAYRRVAQKQAEQQKKPDRGGQGTSGQVASGGTGCRNGKKICRAER